MREVLLAPNDVLRGSVAEYKILNLIGRGGMGAVYRVQRLVDQTTWALKEMRPLPDTPAAEVSENRKLFEQEADLLRRLSHPSLPVVAETFVHNDRPVMVMEYVPGQTLEDRIREANAPLLRQQAIGLGIQVARVLSYLHTQNPPIIYRDMKPSNVMVMPEGLIKLLDFGVARTYKVRKSKDTIAMGSAGYAPPEQYGKQQTDARSDIYALGATLLHLLTNMPPIPLQTPAPGSIIKLNPSVDSATEKVIIRAMQEQPAQRFQTMAEFEQALRDCLGVPFQDPALRAPPPPPVKPGSASVPTNNEPTVAVPPVQTAPPPVVQTPPIRPPSNGSQSVPSRVPTSSIPQTVSPPTAPPSTPAQPPRPSNVAPVTPQPIPGGVACGRCGRVNKPGARFCAGCGAPIGVAAVARLLLSSPRGNWEQKIERTQIKIGRRDPRQNHYPEIDLAEHDRGIASRHHALITRDGDNFLLTDLGSTNGTFLNGRQIPPRQPQAIRPGDRIKVGEVEMEFRWG